MRLTKKRTKKHPLAGYIRNWKAYNTEARKTVYQFLFRTFIGWLAVTAFVSIWFS